MRERLLRVSTFSIIGILGFLLRDRKSQPPEGYGPITLKEISIGKQLSFYCSLTEDSKEWITVTKGASARYLSTANSFGWTGTTIGMFATKPPVK